MVIVIKEERIFSLWQQALIGKAVGKCERECEEIVNV